MGYKCTQLNSLCMSALQVNGSKLGAWGPKPVIDRMQDVRENTACSNRVLLLLAQSEAKLLRIVLNSAKIRDAPPVAS